MRRYIIDYLKTYVECQRYKPSNSKPAGLLQTSVLRQRMEVLFIDLFGPLPPSQDDKKWILIIQHYATKWIELFALSQVTAENGVWTLINKVALHYGLFRRIISDNGTQFISAVMQKITFCLGITQSFTPVYQSRSQPGETPQPRPEDAAFYTAREGVSSHMSHKTAHHTIRDESHSISRYQLHPYLPYVRTRTPNH
jgi:hypothetical protein